MRVRDIMTSPVVGIGCTDSLKVADDVMQWKHVRHLPVVDDAGRLVGLVTHRDLLAACVSSLADISPREQEKLLRGIPVQEIMHTRMHTVGPEENARVAAQMMLDHKIGCVLVV